MVLHRQENLNGTIQARLPLINLQSWKTISMAKQGADLATLGVEEARQQLLLGTAQAYFVTAMMRSLIGLREEALDSAARHLDVAKAHFDAGMGVRIDVVRAETDVEQARKELLTAHLTLDNARDALGLLTGLGGLPMPADDAVVSNIRNDEDELVDRAVNNRGDFSNPPVSQCRQQRSFENRTWQIFLLPRLREKLASLRICLSPDLLTCPA